jgi:hypothetical protein
MAAFRVMSKEKIQAEGKARRKKFFFMFASEDVDLL